MKIKKEQFKLFVEYCEKWQKELGLTRYSIAVFFDSDGDDFLAHTMVDTEGMMASVFLATDWELTRPTKKNLEKVACHEMLEIFYWPTREELERTLQRDIVNGVIHTHINPLLPLLLK